MKNPFRRQPTQSRWQVTVYNTLWTTVSNPHSGIPDTREVEMSDAMLQRIMRNTPEVTVTITGGRTHNGTTTIPDMIYVRRQGALTHTYRRIH